MINTTATHPTVAAGPVAVAETHPAIVVEVAVDNALTARLIHPREEVAGALRVAIEKGDDIRARRIRYQEDLDEARLAKLRWTQGSIDLLGVLFDNSSVADYCNDWVGKIFPEYAEFGNFVEQFYEEMEYRLAKLRSVLSGVERVIETPGASMMPQAEGNAPAGEAPAAPALVAPRIAAVELIPPPVVRPVPASHVMLFGAIASDPAHRAVSALLERLGIGAYPATDPLAAGATDAAVFIAPSQPADAAAVRVALFHLGYAVGRLGTNRVCVLHPASAPLCPESRVVHIPADPTGAWQLQLARHLKQAGLNADLNKLC